MTQNNLTKFIIATLKAANVCHQDPCTGAPFEGVSCTSLNFSCSFLNTCSLTDLGTKDYNDLDNLPTITDSFVTFTEDSVSFNFTSADGASTINIPKFDCAALGSCSLADLGTRNYSDLTGAPTDISQFTDLSDLLKSYTLVANGTASFSLVDENSTVVSTINFPSGVTDTYVTWVNNLNGTATLTSADTASSLTVCTDCGSNAWYEQGTTDSPGAITDNIYTQGYAQIGDGTTPNPACSPLVINSQDGLNALFEAIAPVEGSNKGLVMRGAANSAGMYLVNDTVTVGLGPSVDTFNIVQRTDDDYCTSDVSSTLMQIDNTGKLCLPAYSGNTHDNTTTYVLGVNDGDDCVYRTIVPNLMQWYSGGQNMRVYATFDPFTTGNYTANSAGDYSFNVPAGQQLDRIEWIIGNGSGGTLLNMNGSNSTIIRLTTPTGNTSIANVDRSQPHIAINVPTAGNAVYFTGNANLLGTTSTVQISAGTLVITSTNLLSHVTGKLSITNLIQN